jgi:hypothetical protein
MVKETSIVKKPSKKDRLLAKRLQWEEMLKVDLSMSVTLECPECNIQQVMTLDDYFKKINYGSVHQKKLKCKMCPKKPELLFYKVSHKQIAAAGFNWERKRQGITEGDMLNKIEDYERVKGIAFPDKVLIE